MFICDVRKRVSDGVEQNKVKLSTYLDTRSREGDHAPKRRLGILDMIRSLGLLG